MVIDFNLFIKILNINFSDVMGVGKMVDIYFII